MRKIIVPVGYMCSGSSAITDLIKEFEKVNNDYGYLEYIFLHCPDGLFDLEDKLLHSNNALRSDEAIHSFLKRMKELYAIKYWWVANYKTVIGAGFYKETLNFINEITDYKLKNYWYMQEIPDFKMYIQLIIRKIVYILTFKKIKMKKPLKYDEIYLSYPTNEKFYNAARKYLKKVLAMFDSSGDDLLLDQLLLPFNLFRIDNYFDKNLKVIVVERDPRDIFISNKYIFTPKEKGVPYSCDVKEFCEQFKKIRNLEKKVNNKNIMRINFEDLIYRYDETKNKIVKFLGFEKRKHLTPKKYFDPSISIKNTKLYVKEEYKKEAEYIEEHLKEYLYDYKGEN